MSPVTEISRKNLYEQIWTTATHKLAKTYGVSDVGLAKICKRHQIPRPSVGYWAKKTSGKRTRRKSLPACDDPDLQIVVIAGTDLDETPVPEMPPFDDDVLELLERAKSLVPFPIPKQLSHPHPLVEATREGFQSGSTDHRHLVSPEYHRKNYTLSIDVAEANIPRALRFMDGLIKAVEKIGGSVTVEAENWRKCTVVTLLGEEAATIRLREKIIQNSLPPRTKKNPDSYPRAEYIPSGKLILDSGPSCSATAYARDTDKRYKIEDLLDRVVLDFIEGVGSRRIWQRRYEAEREVREREEQTRREKEEALRLQRQELENQQAEERRRVEDLMERAEAWSRSCNLRAFLEAFTKLANNKYGEIPPDSDLARQLQWGQEQADRLDPLVPTPPSIVDQQI